MNTGHGGGKVIAMDELSVKHVEWMEAQNHWAQNTISARARVLRSLGDAATADRARLDDWWQSRSHLSDNTRSADLTHVREFYKWCQIYYHRMDDPSIHLLAPRLENTIYDEKVSDEDILELEAKLPHDLRRAVVLGAYAGLRVSESAALDWSHVDSKEDTIKVVRSKGKKTRVVYVSPELISRLAVGSRKRSGNVVTAGGEPYTASRLQRRLNRAMQAAGCEFSSHALRHRYGIATYRATGDLLAVAEQMGHGSVNTTKLYASADSEVKRRLAAAVML